MSEPFTQPQGVDGARTETSVLQALNNGSSLESIVGDLMKDGWKMGDATRFVREVMRRNRIGMGSLQLRRAAAIERPHLLVVGTLLLVIGLAASVASYLRSVQLGTPSFMVAFGAVAGGIGMIALGLSNRGAARR